MMHLPLHITLSMIPPKATAQGKGVMVIAGKPRFFEKKEQRQAHNLLASYLLPHVPAAPFENCIRVHILWVWPWRKTEKKFDKMFGEAWHGSKPDLANLEKGLIDTMTRMGFWVDDSLIASELLEKKRGDTPRLEIDVEEL